MHTPMPTPLQAHLPTAMPTALPTAIPATPPHRRRMRRTALQAVLLLAAAWPALPLRAADPAVLVIGHPALPRLDAPTVARLYTGRAVEVGGTPVTVVNAPSGSGLRERFLAHYLQQDDDQYRAYWTVRRHIGKGVPPRELSPSAEVIQFVRNTPGAVGYIDATEARPGLNVLSGRP